MKKLQRWLGLEKRTEYVDIYFDRANFLSSIYMSVIIIILETWMLISLLVRWVRDDPTRSTEWFISHCLWYLLFLGTAITMLYFSVNFLNGRFKHRLPGKLLLIFFSLVALYFGMSVSYSDYTRGEQILCFITMVIFVVGLLNWRPVTSILGSSIVFLIFYILMDRAPGIPITYATQVNYFILWIAIVMLSLAVYSQRLAEAEKNQQLEISLVRDELTGIPNQTCFLTKAAEQLAAEGPEGKLFLYLDITNFKAYNEKYGFEAGNELIQTIAKLIGIYFEGDLCARFSDDHFVVLTRQEGATERMNGLVTNVENLKRTATLQVSMKIGGYVPDQAGEDVAVACDHARYACISIKKHSEKNYLEYDKAMDQAFYKRQYIITHVDEAVKNGYIQVYYQPVVDSADGKICGVEALARWMDPGYGFLSPGDFIPALEEYRLIHRIDRAMLDRVCGDLRIALDADRDVVPVSINISRLDFELMDVPGVLDEIIQKYELPPEYLHVEITESAVLADDTELLKALGHIRNMGVGLWLDDFGSGYSSLNSLKDYDFDVMKIDMVFLRDLQDNEKAQSILKSIVAMADMISMETLTEGVEEEDQARFLTSIGCKRLQGFLFGKPMPIAQLRDQFHCF